MVFAGERTQCSSRKSFRRLQPSNTDRRCSNLRNRAEKPAFAQLFSGPLQRQAGERCARIPSHVRRGNEKRVTASPECPPLYSALISRQVTSSCWGVEPTKRSRLAISLSSISFGVADAFAPSRLINRGSSYS